MRPPRTNKKRLSFVSLLMAIAMLLRPVFASANPEGGVVAAGQANIITAPTMVDIHQQTHKVVIDWRGFDIAPNERTEFHQPSTSAIALNRVNSPNASSINGTLKANGNIIIVNQNGVLFGREAKVDVNGLVATSADTDNDRFMNEAKVTLDKAGSPDAVVSNEGTITAKESGLVGFVAPRVENSGVITARLGRVQLASGEKATVDFYGDGLLEVAVGEEVTHQLAKNTGTINAEGGTIALTAAAGRKLLSSSIEVGGELHAQTVSQQEGKIIIAAAGKNAVTNNIAANKNGSNSNVASTVTVRGKLHASGNKAGERGGKITITGDEIVLKSGTNISAKGAAGGGVVRIGGEYLGQGTTPTARTTTVESGAILDASATEQGHGGEVIVFADGDTIFNGLIYANGAGQRGNGGFVETSGKSRLHIGGMVYATASGSGRAGQWLLDPADITITAATNSNITGSTPFTATNTGSQLSAATIVTALNAGTNVTVQTNNDAFAGNGDIFVNSAITSTGAGALTISAFRNILVSAAISLNGGSLTLRSDNTGIGSGAITTSAALSTNGGNITIGGGNGAITAATYNANGSVATAASGFARGNAAMTQGVTIGGAINSGNNGNIIINGRGFTGTASSVGVEQLAGNAITATGTGSIQISGINQGTAANSTQSNGVVLRNNVTTLNGAIQIQGQGGAGTDAMSNSGVLISSTGGLVRSTGTGAITLSGVGGSSTGGRNYGVLVNNTSGVSPTGGGTILIYGQGGNAGSNNAGVGINDAGTGSIVGGGGAIIVNGLGGNTANSNNYGVVLLGTGAGIGVLSNTGTGTITVTGTGAGSGAGGNNYGVLIIGTGARISSSGSGAISVTGTGGGGTGGSNYGVLVNSTSGITTSAGSPISITGQGGSAGSNAVGVLIGSTGSVVAGSSAITITGTGGLSNGSSSHGVQFNGGGAGTGALTTSGAVNITGTGGGGGATNNNHGIFLSGTGATIAKTGAGAFTITGTGGTGSGGSNNGIHSAISDGITSAANATLNATAGAGAGSSGIVSTIANGIRTTGAATLTLFSNSFNISAASAVNSITTLTVAPLTAVTFGLGTGAGVATINNASLNNLAATTGYIFGSATTPDITVNTTAPFTSRALTFTSSGNITLNNSFNQLTSLTTTSPTGATTINAAIGAVTAIGAYTATGRDLLINASLRSSANISATLTRDITLAAGATLTNGAGSALTLRAANNSVTGTGNLSLLGNLNVGTGTLTLSSGVNGTRPSWTANTTSLQRQGANFGTISIQGFLNTTIDRQLNSNGNVTILSFENLGITSGTNVTTGTGTNSLSLRAANGVASALGTLSIDGTIGVGRGSLTLLSGVDGGGSRPSLALSTSKLSRLSTSFGTISIQGFNDITLDQLLNSTGNVALSNNTRIFLQNTTSSTGGTITFSNPVVIAEGQTATVTTTNRNIAFSSTINGTAGGAVETLTVNPGTANATFSSTIDGIGLNVSAGTATFNGVLGGTTALNATSISAINALTLPNVTASSLFAETTGATARLSLNGSVTSTGLGNALTINSSNTLTKGGAGNITTNNGVITLSAANFLYLANSFNILSGGSDIILTAPTNIVSTGTVSIISGGGDVNLNGPVSISAPLTLTLGSGALTFGGAVNGNNNFASTFSVLAVGAGGGSGGSDGAVIGGGGGGGAAVDSVVNTVPNALYTISVGGGGGAGVSDNAGASSVGLGGINGGGIGGRAGTTGTSGGGGGGGGWSGISSGGTNFVIAGGGAGGGGANEGTANDVGAQGGGSQLNGANTNSNGAAGTNFSGNGGGGGGGGGGLLGGRGQSALTGAALSSGGSNFGNAANVSNNITNGNAGDTEAGGGAGGGTPGIAGARATFYGLGGLEGAGGDGSTNSDGADGVVIIRYTGSESQAVIVGGVATTVGGDTIITYSNPGAGLFSPISGCSGSCNLTVTAGSVTFGGEIGTTTPLDNVSITTTDAMALPSVTATNILARTTNATANLTILPGSVLTATGTGTPLTLAAGRDFINNAGAGALVVSGTGSPRWLVYSTNPANDTVGGLSNNFNRYSCAYASGGNCAFNATLNQTVSVPASGNGLLYSYTPTINITPAAISNLVYGAATPSLTGYAYNTITSADYLSAGDFAADSITGSLDGSTTYAPGPVTGGVGNYNIDYVSGNLVSLLGYGFTYANNANAITVIPRTVTVSLIGAVSRVYDGSLAATLAAGNYSISNVFAGDVLGISNTSGTYDTKHVGTGKTITVTGLTLTGAPVANYVLSSTTASGAIGDITARALTIGAVGINRVYNGLTGATVTLNDDRVTGDVLTTGYTTADFSDRHVGTGKTVTVTGITLGGADAGNYTFNTSTSTTADITARALTIGAVGINRVYNGLTGATVTLNDDRVAGDVLTTGYTTADFSDRHVGTGKTVTVNGLTLSGTDAGNYTFNTSTSTTADITARALTIGAVGINKPFDGNTAANVTLNDDRIAGDLLSTGFGMANFATSSPGVGILITVSITLSGIDAGNYTFNTSATTTADITGSVPVPTPAPSALPNTVVKVTQDTGEAVTSSSDDGIYASPTTMYQLVYLPANAPTENRILNRAPQVRSAAAPLTTAFVAPDEERRLRNARAKRSRNLLARGSRTFIFDANTPAVRRPGGFEASPSVKSI